MAKIKEFIEYLSAEEYTGLFREACEKGKNTGWNWTIRLVESCLLNLVGL